MVQRNSRAQSGYGYSRAYSITSSARARDRKSTRLNSSHLVISYAVFCLKKKKYFFDNGKPGALFGLQVAAERLHRELFDEDHYATLIDRRFASRSLPTPPPMQCHSGVPI